MTALAWRLIRFRKPGAAIRPWMVVASGDGSGTPPAGAEPPPAGPSGGGTAAPDPGEGPGERDPRRVEIAEQSDAPTPPYGIPAQRRPEPAEAAASPDTGAGGGYPAHPPGGAGPAGPAAYPVGPAGAAYPAGAAGGSYPTGPYPTAPYPQAPWAQPPGGYGAPPPMPPPMPRPGRGRRIVALVAVAVLLVAAAAVGIFLYERSTRAVTLLAADEPGDDPFTPTFVQGGSLLPTARFDAVANRTPAGNQDGLYLDMVGSSGCDRTPLATALTGDPQLAAAWAIPLGIAAPDVSAYVATLTPVRLRADTRLTAHGNGGDRAEPYAATLQAGTAVLVDDRGMPRVRCADGAPLTGSQPVADPYFGGAWDGFDPAAMVEVRPAAAKIVEFGLVDTAGEQPFRRPAGTTGDKDVAALPGTGRLDGSYVLTGTQTRCDGLQDCPSVVLLTFVSRFAGCPDACTVTDRELGDAVVLTRDGAVWRASGTVPTQRRVAVCDGREVPYTFTTAFTVTDSTVVDGIWTATKVTADHEVQAPQTGSCTAAQVAWTVNGVGG